jgi:hypothetical protein
MKFYPVVPAISAVMLGARQLRETYFYLWRRPLMEAATASSVCLAYGNGAVGWVQLRR